MKPKPAVEEKEEEEDPLSEELDVRPPFSRWRPRILAGGRGGGGDGGAGDGPRLREPVTATSAP
jgi:phage terminase large subunit-like protein